MNNTDTHVPTKAKDKPGNERISMLHKPVRHERNREIQTKPVLHKQKISTTDNTKKE